jgi:hypothetical protein
MRHTRIWLVLTLIIPMAGCTVWTSVFGGSTQQILYSLHGDYNTLLAASVTYAELPRCSATQPAPCSKQDIVDKMAAADNVAWPLVQKSDALAQDSNTPADALTAIKSELSNALSAFKLVFTSNNVPLPAGA